MDNQTRQAARLWTLAQPAVSAFVLSIVRDFAIRDDVLQETAVAVLESFDRYDPGRPFVSWAIGVAQNQIRLYWRREKRNQLIFDDDVVEQMAESFQASPAAEIDSLAFLHDCLNRLDGKARQLIELRYTRNLKPAAISELIGMSANSVAKALQRLRDQLRDCIDRKSSSEGCAS
ncbi:MAG: sigma-70 family RNA polymerase sigma factor [Planctomycetaceae bacterium]